MSIAVQRRRGTTAEHATFTGLLGEITVDTDKDTLVAHDGALAGGYPMAREDAVTNPNILINSDGTNPVNQLGVADADSVTHASYSLDGWKDDADTVTSNQDIQSDSFGAIATSTDTGSIGKYQPLEDFVKLRGKTITLSAGVISNTALAILRVYDDANNDSEFHSGGGTEETLSVTLDIRSAASMVLAMFKVSGAITTGDYIRITWIKLEVGSVATKFVADLPSVNLAKCHRRMFSIGGVLYQTIGHGFVNNPSTGYITLKLPVPMSSTPALAYGPLSAFRLISNGNTYFPTSIAYRANFGTTDGDGNIDGVGLLVTYSTAGMTVDEPCLLTITNNTAAYLRLTNNP